MGVGGNVMPQPLYTGTVSITIGIGLRYPRCSGGPRADLDGSGKCLSHLVSVPTAVSWPIFRNRRKDNIKMNIMDIGSEYVK
jgi:hypothetical protein